MHRNLTELQTGEHWFSSVGATQLSVNFFQNNCDISYHCTTYPVKKRSYTCKRASWVTEADDTNREVVSVQQSFKSFEVEQVPVWFSKVNKYFFTSMVRVCFKGVRRDSNPFVSVPSYDIFTIKSEVQGPSLRAFVPWCDPTSYHLRDASTQALQCQTGWLNACNVGELGG